MLSAAVSSADSLPDVDVERRFGGIGRLYGERALARLRASSVCVV
ncbi:MAG: tRNA cyclic N6-threonylcarbamoyladenosine(37) synthase TcdA, partial [Betaproteobacteria bacterium HGW-Betaproteobacteria-21]